MMRSPINRPGRRAILGKGYRQRAKRSKEPDPAFRGIAGFAMGKHFDQA